MSRPATYVGCSVLDCEGSHHAGGLCLTHYMAEHREDSRYNGDLDLRPLLGLTLDPETQADGALSDRPTRILAPLDGAEVLRCPDCGKRYGLIHGWGWHCRLCHRTWPEGQPCAECGMSTSWRSGVYGSGEGELKRQRPSKALQKEILEEQRNRCYYCIFEFGTIFRRHNKPFALRVEWDHFVPYSYSLRNDTDNWVASCQVCNRIKGCLVFNSSDKARAFIQERRDQKGYTLDENERMFLEAQR